MTHYNDPKILAEVSKGLGEAMVGISVKSLPEEELLAGVNNENFRALMAFQAARARQYYESGRKLYPLLDRRSRACPKTLESVYSRLLDRMEAEDFPVFEKRVSISRTARIALVVRLWLRSVAPIPW